MSVCRNLTSAGARARCRSRRVWFVMVVSVVAFVALSTALSAARSVQPAEQVAAVVHSGGEASLKLPDLGQVEFLGLNGRTLLTVGLLVCVLGLAFGMMTYRQVK